MLRFSMTPAIIAALNQLSRYNCTLDSDDDLPLDEPAVEKPISHYQILAISRNLKQKYAELEVSVTKQIVSYHLDDLLRGSQVYLPAAKPRNEPVEQPFHSNVLRANTG